MELMRFDDARESLETILNNAISPETRNLAGADLLTLPYTVAVRD
jgi:hypothetical protein